MASNQGTRDLAACLQEAWEPQHRTVALSVPCVELRLYRSSRTASNPIKQPPHFVFNLRCDWSSPDMATAACWWDVLPQNYTVRRRWLDIVRFHEVLKADLGYDARQGCRRVRARVPDLPERGDLDKFVVALAATGDACALNRAQQDSQGGRKCLRLREKALEELEDLHFIYVENRLAPYFADVNKVLTELPAEVLRGSMAFRKFVTTGIGCSSVSMHTEGPCRPGPMAPGGLAVSSAVDGPHRTRGGAAKAAAGQKREPGGQSAGSPAHKTKPAAAPTAKKGGGPSILPSSQAVRSRAGSRTRPSTTLHGLDIHRSASAPSAAAAGSAESTSQLAAAGMSAPGDTGEHLQDALSTAKEVKQVANYQPNSSHYGFFANSLSPGENYGCSSTYDFWKRLAVKERKELSRRTLCQIPGDATPPRVKTGRRLPSLPLQALHDAGRPPEARRRLRVRAPGAAGGANADAKVQTLWLRIEVIARDICEGLRVAVLGDQPSQVPRSMRRHEPLEERPEATREEAIKVFRAYRAIAEMGVGGELEASSSEEGQESRRDLSSRSGEDATPKLCMGPEPRWSSNGLAPISWSALLAWAQNKEDFASDFRHRSVCAALNRGLRDWRRAHMGRSQHRAGVHISQVFQWLWPDVSDEHIATMLSWVCLLEIDRIRQPTPRVIDIQEAKRLEKIFRLMGGGDGRDYVTAEEIAGGRDQGVDSKLRNIVDRETVVAVCGKQQIRRTAFLELMCEDSFRGHEQALQVVLQDGRRVVRQSRSALGVDIWVLEEVPKEEEEQRLLVDAIEAEVRHWRRRSEPRLSFCSGDTVQPSVSLCAVDRHRKLQDADPTPVCGPA